MKSRYLHESEDKDIDIVPIVLYPDSSEPVVEKNKTTTITTTDCIDSNGNTSSSTKKRSKTTTVNTLDEDCDMACNKDEDEEGFKMKINSGKGAKIPLKQGLTKLVENACKCGIDFKSGSEPVGVINCCDGASHEMTRAKEANVITRFIAMFSGRSINRNKMLVSNPKSILTLLQAQAKESWFNVEQLLGKYYDEVNNDSLLKGVIDDDKSVEFYNLHDGKMLYLLTQHSQWSRKHHPFLSCKCKKGKAVHNGQNHTCTMMSNDEYIRLHTRSKKAYCARLASPNFQNYTEKQHKD